MVRGESALKASEDAAAEQRRIEAAQHDPSRFAELYEDNFERVYAFIARRVRDRDQAQDLTADVFHDALANLGRFEWRGVPFAAWLMRIASNAIVDHSRRVKRSASECDVADLPGPADPGLEDIEHRARLFKLVEGLPADQHRVIVMRFGEQNSIAEISKKLGRSEGAIKQLQFRGLQNLRVRMGNLKAGKTNG